VASAPPRPVYDTQPTPQTTGEGSENERQGNRDTENKRILR